MGRFGCVVAVLACACAMSWAGDRGRAAFGEHEVAYEVHGEGEGAIVFVHGWASSGVVWHKQIEGIETDRRLVTVDLIGHGKSDAPEDLEYSLRTLAKSIAAVMDDLELEEAVLVGHSNGVPTVREFYRMHPERVEGLVLVDGALRQAMAPEMMQPMVNMIKAPNYEQTIRVMTSRMPSFELSEADLEGLTEMAVKTPQFVSVQTMEAAMDPALWKEDVIDAPVLIVRAQSPFWKADEGEFAEKIAPGAEQHDWKGVSHFLMLERPEAFNELVEGFVGRLD